MLGQRWRRMFRDLVCVSAILLGTKIQSTCREEREGRERVERATALAAAGVLPDRVTFTFRIQLMSRSFTCLFAAPRVRSCFPPPTSSWLSIPSSKQCRQGERFAQGLLRGLRRAFTLFPRKFFPGETISPCDGNDGSSVVRGCSRVKRQVTHTHWDVVHKIWCDKQQSSSLLVPDAKGYAFGPST